MTSRLFTRLQALLVIPLYVLANPISTGYVPPGAVCKDHAISVTVTSENYPWVAPKWVDNYGFIDFASAASTRLDAPYPPSPIGPPVNETGTYEVSATYCTPRKPGKNSRTVLLASHGLGFDRSYWNPSYKPETYNFVQYAIDKGYSVFFYDRLGVGASTKVSGFKNQLNIQTPILISLARSLRHGSYTLPGQPLLKTLIFVGHSFGSYLSNSAIAAAPSIADAAVLTGYGINGSDPRIILQGFAPRIANLQDAQKFGAFDAGYITTGDVFANINSFFKAPEYEHDVAAFSEENKQPFAVSELLSVAPAVLESTPKTLDANAFKGPVLVISGEFDHILCGGYCPGELEASFGDKFRNLETYVQPLAGHGVNFATNTTGFYGKIFSFISEHKFQGT